MIRPTLPQVCAAVAGVILLLAVVAWWTSDLPPLYLGPPSITAPPVQVLTVHVPDIGPFEEFTAIPDNPFIPYEQRLRQRYRHHGPYGNDATPVAAPPPPHATASGAPPPPLVLPSLVPAGATAPTCVGLVDVLGQQQLSVLMPGQPFAVSMRIGDRVAGWTLVAITNGNEATFIGPDGDREVYPIGQGNLAVAQNMATPGSTAPTAGPPAVPPHGPHRPHAHNRPRGPGGNGGQPGWVPHWGGGNRAAPGGGTPPGSPLQGASANPKGNLFGGPGNGP